MVGQIYPACRAAVCGTRSTASFTPAASVRPSVRLASVVCLSCIRSYVGPSVLSSLSVTLSVLRLFVCLFVHSSVSSACTPSVCSSVHRPSVRSFVVVALTGRSFRSATRRAARPAKQPAERDYSGPLTTNTGNGCDATIKEKKNTIFKKVSTFDFNINNDIMYYSGRVTMHEASGRRRSETVVRTSYASQHDQPTTVQGARDVILTHDTIQLPCRVLCTVGDLCITTTTINGQCLLRVHPDPHHSAADRRTERRPGYSGAGLMFSIWPRFLIPSVHVRKLSLDVVPVCPPVSGLFLDRL